MIDPRLHVISKRLEKIKKIIAVSGGKGGIGKSTVASVLALCMTKNGYKTGLLDLDLSGPSTHIILGIKGAYPEEDKGLIPPEIHGIKYMSIIYFAGNNPSPLRGSDISNIIIELLTITIWDQLDVLILDMPPGISDSILDVIRLIKKMNFLVVTIPSKVAIGVMKKEMKILMELNIPVMGVLENMRIKESPLLSDMMSDLNIPVLGTINFDQTIEDATGNMDKLIETDFYKQLDRIFNTRIKDKL
ncbi:MAG: P-loop NTPase [Proteobacteria bacterium]|nr:P-loop NTPase [Pseudomonadota bacterium]